MRSLFSCACGSRARDPSCVHSVLGETRPFCVPQSEFIRGDVFLFSFVSFSCSWVTFENGFSLVTTGIQISPPSPLSPGRYATFCRTSSLPRTLEVASVADFRSFPFFAFLYLIYQPLFALINRRSLVEKPKTTEVFSLLF